MSSLVSDLVGDLTRDISKLDPLCDGVVSEVGMACGRGTVMLLTVTRFEDETADGRDDPEAGGKIRQFLAVGIGGTIREFNARWIFDASLRVFWNKVFG